MSLKSFFMTPEQDFSKELRPGDVVRRNCQMKDLNVQQSLWTTLDAYLCLHSYLSPQIEPEGSTPAP